METLVGKTRGKGVKVQHMVNVEKANDLLDITTICHTENNEAPKTFVVLSEKEIVPLRTGANNLSFGVEGNNLAWALLVALSYYYVLTKELALPIARYYIYCSMSSLVIQWRVKESCQQKPIQFLCG